MPIPRSIEEAAKRADDFFAQQGTPTTAPVEQAAPVAAAGTTPVPAAEASTPTPALESGWEQKYKVLQGKFNAEVPRLTDEVRTLKQQLSEAVARMNETATRQPAAPDLSALTDAEREQYGEDFLKVVAKVAAQQQAPVPTVDKELQDRLSRVEDVMAETKEDAFFRKLGEVAPNWETLNTDAGFLAWLSEVDPFSGRTRQDLFNDAYNRLDVKRVANFFNSHGGNQSTVSRAETARSLESQVTPRPNGAAPAPMQGKPIYTTRDIAKFYDDVRRGEYQGREADIARIEQDIFAAQREGRVK